MSEYLKVPTGDSLTGDSNIDEFYVRRINWLITVGRSDLIDEIADDCERRRTERHAAPTPNAVEIGTRLAVAKLRHTLRPAYRHRPAPSSIHR